MKDKSITALLDLIQEECNGPQYDYPHYMGRIEGYVKQIHSLIEKSPWVFSVKNSSGDLEWLIANYGCAIHEARLIEIKEIE